MTTTPREPLFCAHTDADGDPARCGCRHTAPERPADPEWAALELLVRLTPDLLGRDWPTRETLQGFAALLSAEDAFAGMSWHDARHAAAAILCDATNRGHPAGFLRGRADRALAGSDAITWDDPAATGPRVHRHRNPAGAMSRDIRAVLRVAPDAGDAGGDDSGLAASER